MGCNPCCCSDCTDKPRKLVISLEWPSGSGQVIPADTEFDPPTYSAVSTNCLAGKADRYVASVVTVSGGSGYTEAPAVSLSGGGTDDPAIVAATVYSPITGITITKAGDGYTSNPTVKFSTTPIGVGARAAAATAIVRGSVTSVTLANGGFEYTELPVISVGGGGSGAVIRPKLGNGYVIALEIIDGGEGYTTSATAAIAGSSFSATLFRNAQSGSLTSAIITKYDYLAGYVFGAEPVVEIQPAVKKPAQVRAVVGYSITGLTIEDGGSGYTVAPSVTISGDGFGAAATAVVTGAVDEIVLADAGRYLSQKYSNGSQPFDWPTATISGGGGTGAEIDPAFEGSVEFSVPLGGGGAGYDSPPTISVAGDASGVAELSWGQGSQTRTIDITNCSAYEQFSLCTQTSSLDFPEVPCSGCGGTSLGTAEEPESDVFYGEELSWTASAVTSLPQSHASISGRSFVGNNVNIGVTGTDFRDYDFVFPEEGVYANWRVEWFAAFRFDEETAELDVDQREEKAYIRRNYSRVPPTGEMEVNDNAFGGPVVRDEQQLSFSMLPFGSMMTKVIPPAKLTPVFKRYGDYFGNPFWRVEGFSGSTAIGGKNLYLVPENSIAFPGITGTIRVKPSPGANMTAATGAGFACNYTAIFDEPVISAYGTSVFFGETRLPDLAFVFTPLADQGTYAISAVTIVDGGEYESFVTAASLRIRTLGVGYVESEPFISLTIQNGAVTGATISFGGVFRGGGTITLVTVADESIEDVFNDGSRIFTGRSPTATQSAYSEPTITAAPASGDTLAQLTVETTEEEDENGDPYWYVSGVTVDDGGGGHPEDVEIVFTVGEPNGIEATPARATGVLSAREEPALTASSAGGSGATFTLSYTPSGDIWEVTSISASGGTGYTDNAEVVFSLGTNDFSDSSASAYITTLKTEPTLTASVAGGSGAELTVQTQSALGLWEVASVTVVAGGTGYTDGDVVTFSGGDQGDGGAYATITTDVNGVIQSVTVFFGGYYFTDSGEIESATLTASGAYYKQPGVIESVTIEAGGRYFDLDLTETETPLPALTCLGEIAAPDWEEYNYPGPDYVIAVGQTFPSTQQYGCWQGGPTSFYEWDRTRRCPLPVVTLELDD